MARKRKRKRGASRSNAALFLIVAVLIAAAVAFAVFPRNGHRARRRVVATRPVARVTLAPTPAPAVAPPVSPSPTTLASPSASPSASPAVATAAPAAAPSAPAGTARVAIIVDDCGQWIDTERGFLRLPIPVTLAVLPYVRYTTTIADEAAAAGKGVMLHLPMEPISHINPGPGEITVAMNDAQVDAQTAADVAQVPLAKGFNNHEGSAATADPRVMRDVLGVAKDHGLFFIDSRTTAKTVGASIARAQGVATASRQVFLDNHADLGYTESMLEQTVAIAKRDGSAIAIGHPKPTTLEALRIMYPKMQAEGVQFVLVAQLAH